MKSRFRRREQIRLWLKILRVVRERGVPISRCINWREYERLGKAAGAE